MDAAPLVQDLDYGQEDAIHRVPTAGATTYRSPPHCSSGAALALHAHTRRDADRSASESGRRCQLSPAAVPQSHRGLSPPAPSGRELFVGQGTVRFARSARTCKRR